MDEQFENAELNVFYELTQETSAKIKVELLDETHNLVKSVEQEILQPIGKLSIAIENPEKWDAEHPNLYTVVTTLFEEEKETYNFKERIGFREVVVEGNQLLVNGKPVKLRGACRHDIHPLLGRMTTAEYDKQDVLLAKECQYEFYTDFTLSSFGNLS